MYWFWLFLGFVFIFLFLLADKYSELIKNIKIEINNNKRKTDVDDYLSRNGYSINDFNTVKLFNRGVEKEDDLTGYLLHLKDTYGSFRYCHGSEANSGTRLNFEEGVYDADILGSAVWVNLYRKLDRKISNEALIELVKLFIQKANLPLEIQYQLATQLGFEADAEAIHSFKAINEKIKQLEKDVEKKEKIKNFCYFMLVVPLLLCLLDFMKG